MTCEPRKRRRSIRLAGYDYSQEGAYFITICAQDREQFFGNILDDQMQLSDAGRMVERWWMELANKFPSVETDEEVVMPNHFHGIIGVVGADPCVRPDDPRTNGGAHAGAPLHEIVRWFKTMTTNEYIRGVRNYGWPRLRNTLWQRNYFEHIIRNQHGLQRIREYIATNPQRWLYDKENPQRTGPDDFDVWLESLANGRGGPMCPPQ